MLPASHNRAYQDFLTLLTEFKDCLNSPEGKGVIFTSDNKFQLLQQYFAANIANLESKDIEISIIARWQSVQIEIKREFKLLTTDILFLASARRDSTRTKRIESISDRITKLIGYCQILLKKEN